MTEIYITGVELINFQSHVYTKVDLTNGINVFVGTSNSGKSAIVRGIIWNLRNEPSGDEFIRKGTNEAAVITHWSDGHSIERRRGRGGTKNFYSLYLNGELVSEYTGFGTKVPPEIIEIHGIESLSNNVYFNYADQLESAFLISNTPKVRAEVIGNLEELGKIDEELVRINQDIALGKKDKKRINAEVTTLEKEVDSLEADLNLKSTKISTLRMLKDAIEEKSRINTEMNKYLNRLKDIQYEINMYSESIEKTMRIIQNWDEKLPDKISLVNQLSASFSRLVDIQKELSEMKFINDEKLTDLSRMNSIVQSSIDSFQEMNRLAIRLKEVKQAQGTTLKSFSPNTAVIDFSKVDKDVEKYRFAFTNLARLKKIKEDITSNESVVETSKESINTLLNDFVVALKEAEVCPTCSQTTGEVCTHDVEKII